MMPRSWHTEQVSPPMWRRPDVAERVGNSLGWGEDPISNGCEDGVRQQPRSNVAGHGHVDPFYLKYGKHEEFQILRTTPGLSDRIV